MDIIQSELDSNESEAQADESFGDMEERDNKTQIVVKNLQAFKISEYEAKHLKKQYLMAYDYCLANNLPDAEKFL